MFGGLKGLEYSLECDENLQVDDVRLLFDHYLNTCPGQGSRTIRTEVHDAIIMVVCDNSLPTLYTNVSQG